MSTAIPQLGIYFKGGSTPGSYLGLVFLRASRRVQASKIGRDLERLWKSLEEINSVSDFEYNGQSWYEGISTLVGYGESVFDVEGVLRQKPADLMNWRFAHPTANGGEITNGSKLYYADDVTDNHALEDLMVVQFISGSESAVSRSIIETYRCLQGTDLYVSRFYTGFRGGDRNWIGFNDGISNLKSEEREQVIFIQKKKYSEDWLVKGTYMAFLRVAIDLRSWWTTKISEQEFMIGREKSTGCPITRVDSHGKPIVDPGCPLPGTKNVTESRNRVFREYPVSSRSVVSSNLDKLNYSHVRTSRNYENIPFWDPRSFRIFRQGFEFLEASDSQVGFIAGLNFISFQNTPERLFGALTSWRKGNQFESNPAFFPGINGFLRVRSAGIFIVPPNRKNEIFPGSSIFLSSSNSY
jgi:deferrochelatase/peroxidase EfeB